MFIFISYIVLTCLFIALIQRVCLPALAKYAMGDAPTAMLWLLNKIYVRLIHRVESSGNEILPQNICPGPLIVICNHQSPIDPLLVQSQCRFKIRWLMAQEFMEPSLDYVWKHSGVIPVARDGQDSTALRLALRELKNGGVIGLFPEGGIHQPREAIHPFTEGIGAMIAKTHAPVLLVSVTDTPINDEMKGAMFEPSHSKVKFIEIVDYSKNLSKLEITNDLRCRLGKATGWSLVN